MATSPADVAERLRAQAALDEAAAGARARALRAKLGNAARLLEEAGATRVWVFGSLESARATVEGPSPDTAQPPGDPTRRDRPLHVPKILGPDDPARDRRLDWATLMKRAYATDVLVFPRCAGNMRLVALIEDERVAVRILLHLGLPARAPPRGRPWQPPQRELGFDLDATGDD